MIRRIVLYFAFLTALLLSSSVIDAQVTSGNLQGVVTDSNKAAVGGATVKITNTETGVQRSTQTNSGGFYRVTNLLPGSKYKIEVSASGFAGARAVVSATGVWSGGQLSRCGEFPQWVGASVWLAD